MVRYTVPLLFVVVPVTVGQGMIGPTLMAVWSEKLPLCASWPSPLPRLKLCPGHVRKLPVN